MQTVARYTVELQRPDDGWIEIEAATARARRAADDMRDEGTPVRFLRSVFVPEDDTCFFIYEGPSVEAVRDAAGRAQLAPTQVQETITRVQQ